jgi:TetR/AcrR family transcriptional repressor of nem operon
MARPQQFDKDEVLHNAMRVFWRKGFVSTSLTDLLEATNLSKSSLYSSFGGKRELFLAAFDAYRENRRQEMYKILDKGPARQAIESMFQTILEGAKASEFSNGCMSINQAIEMAPHDDDVCAKVKEDFQSMEKALAKTIERGQADGSIRGHKSAYDLARLLVVAFPGLQVMVRARCDTNRLDEALQLLLSLLD